MGYPPYEGVNRTLSLLPLSTKLAREIHALAHLQLKVSLYTPVSSPRNQRHTHFAT